MTSLELQAVHSLREALSAPGNPSSTIPMRDGNVSLQSSLVV